MRSALADRLLPSPSPSPLPPFSCFLPSSSLLPLSSSLLVSSSPPGRRTSGSSNAGTESAQAIEIRGRGARGHERPAEQKPKRQRFCVLSAFHIMRIPSLLESGHRVFKDNGRPFHDCKTRLGFFRRRAHHQSATPDPSRLAAPWARRVAPVCPAWCSAHSDSSDSSDNCSVTTRRYGRARQVELLYRQGGYNWL